MRSIAEAQHLEEIDHQLALFPLDLCSYSRMGVEVLKSKAVLINLRLQEAEKGLRWDGVVIVAIRGLLY